MPEDTTTAIESLKLEFVFVDGDDRSLTIRNPKSNITSSEIGELQTFLQTTNVIIGDKAAGTFGRIRKAARITQTTRKLDLTS